MFVVGTERTWVGQGEYDGDGGGNCGKGRITNFINQKRIFSFIIHLRLQAKTTEEWQAKSVERVP